MPVIEKIDDPEKLLAEIVECIQHRDARTLKTYILEHKIKDGSIFWELILKIGDCVDSKTCESDPDFFDVCCRCLLYLVKVGNPRETLLALLEQVDTFIDDVKFKNFLPPIQTALLKIPSKLFHSLDITLETVSAHLRSLQLPENVQFEGEEVKLFHVDKNVVRLTDILYTYLKFLEPFVNAVDVHLENLTSAARQEALVLKKHLIRIFEHPLCYLVLTYDLKSDQAKSDSRLCAELAMTLLAKVETDFHRLIRNSAQLCEKQSSSEIGDNKQCIKEIKDADLNEEEQDNDENERKLASGKGPKDDTMDLVEAWKPEIHPLALACLSYLIHVEHMGLQKYPAVYRHEYHLNFHLEIMSVLLRNTNFPVSYKGLILCKVLTELVPKNSIHSDQIDNQNYMIVIRHLIHIMIRCPVRDHRVLATNIFPTMISRFQDGGRYQIYQNILSSCEQSGLKGYLVTIVKNDICDSLKNAGSQGVAGEAQAKGPGGPRSLLPECFSGKKLERLLKLVLHLPEGETTDMLENSDQIISSLNLLRFLILADPPASNLTGFWNFLPVIDKDFISPLRRGLDLSRAHYILEQDRILSGKAVESRSGNDPELSLTVAGLTLPMMEEKEKAELIGLAINTHEVMLSLLGRVSELLDQQKRLQTKSDS